MTHVSIHLVTLVAIALIVGRALMFPAFVIVLVVLLSKIFMDIKNLPASHTLYSISNEQHLDVVELFKDIEYEKNDEIDLQSEDIGPHTPMDTLSPIQQRPSFVCHTPLSQFETAAPITMNSLHNDSPLNNSVSSKHRKTQSEMFLQRRRSSLIKLTNFIENYSKVCTIQNSADIGFQIASDLHLEVVVANRKDLHNDDLDGIFASMIKPSAPCLILAGDIGCPATFRGGPVLQRFLAHVSDRFKLVMYVAGNHEYYTDRSTETGVFASAVDVHIQLHEICKALPNVIFMDRKSVLIDDVRIIGATLWSAIEEEHSMLIQSRVRDYASIYLPRSSKSRFSSRRLLRIGDTQKWHQYDLKYITEQIDIAQNLNEKVLIITHHSPLIYGTSHRCHDNSVISSCFASNLEHMLRPPLKAWVFGHTHFCTRKNINGVQLVANQRGYDHDIEEGYQNDMVIYV